DVEKYKEETLKIYYFDEKTKTWSPLADSQVNINTNIITATTTHFTLFAVMGLPKGVQEEKEAPIKPESAKEPEKTEKREEPVVDEEAKEKEWQKESVGKEPTKSETYTFNREMRYGAVGKDIVKLQDLLKALNLLPQDVSCTGYFNVATLKAVNRYQKEVMHINPCNCGVGSQTLAALNAQKVEYIPLSEERYIFTQDFRLGKRGEEVKQLQIRLRELGFFPHWIKSTGWFGPITEKAVNLFQKFYQILEDGIVGPKTREVLDE
ncbi:MAG: peptidoglycan-binding domain-containing protein, partial [Candidatus Jacksonbacteria bacterium]